MSPGISLLRVHLGETILGGNLSSSSGGADCTSTAETEQDRVSGDQVLLKTDDMSGGSDTLADTGA